MSGGFRPGLGRRGPARHARDLREELPRAVGAGLSLVPRRQGVREAPRLQHELSDVPPRGTPFGVNLGGHDRLPPRAHAPPLRLRGPLPRPGGQPSARRGLDRLPG